MSVYGDPEPYTSPDLERSAIEGRLEVAQGIMARAKDSGDHARAASWQRVIDELLDRLNAVSDLAALAAGQAP